MAEEKSANGSVANGLQGQLQGYLAAVRKNGSKVLNSYLYDEDTYIGLTAARVEAQTKIKREKLASGIIGSFVLYLAIGSAAQLLCNLIGFVYPAYASMKALETKGIDDDKRWLTYWVVFGFFSVAEFFTDTLMSWIPFYWIVKVGLFIWLMAPGEMNGAMIVYGRVIRPFFLKNKAATSAFDDATAKVARGVQEFTNGVSNGMHKDD